MEKVYSINVVGCGWKEEKGKAKKVVTPAPIAGDNKSANSGLSQTIHSQPRSWSGGITFQKGTQHSWCSRVFPHRDFSFEETKVESKGRHYCCGHSVCSQGL